MNSIRSSGIGYITTITFITIISTCFLSLETLLILIFLAGFYFKISIGTKYIYTLLCTFLSWFSLCLIQDMNHSISIANLLSELFGSIGTFNILIITSLVISILSAFIASSGHYLGEILQKSSK